jgi:hypothetical protein
MEVCEGQSRNAIVGYCLHHCIAGYMHTHSHTHTRIHTSTCICPHIFTHTHTHTHTHTAYAFCTHTIEQLRQVEQQCVDEDGPEVLDEEHSLPPNLRSKVLYMVVLRSISTDIRHAETHTQHTLNRTRPYSQETLSSIHTLRYSHTHSR